MVTKTKKQEPPKIKTTRETNFLKCQLTLDEILAAGDRLATAIDNLHKLEDEKESVVKSFKAREAAVEAEITKDQLLVRNKYDFRPIECENTLDFNTLQTYTVRLDTNEETMRRNMTEDEKQTTLPFDNE